MTKEKETYIKFALDTKYSKCIPIFLKPQWLDIVAESWEVELYIENNNLIAALPFCIKGNLITKRIYIPDTNFYQSILFFEKNLATEQKNKIAYNLFQKTKKYIQAYFKLTTENNNIDISELKYVKKTYTTNIIKQNYTIENISKTHKRYIQKAIQQNYSLIESEQLEQSFDLILSTFDRQNIKPKIDFSLFKKINDYCKKNNSGKTLDVVDSKQNHLASIFYAEDGNEVYYLYSGYNSLFKNSGAIHYLLNYMIKYSISKNKIFNFCGSQKKSIAHFFKGFGAEEQTIKIWKRNVLS